MCWWRARRCGRTRGELIESHAMESLLAQAKAKYDLVVIDTPPLTAVSDAFPLLGKVDGVIIVGRVPSRAGGASTPLLDRSRHDL